MKYSILLILLFASFTFADRVRYCQVFNTYDTSDNYIAHHFHNWASGNDSGFTEIQTKDGKKLFGIQNGAFTKIQIFESLQIVVLLSNVKVNNPFQFEVRDFNGRAICQKMIGETTENFKKYGISGSVTNYTFWYHDSLPEIRAEDKNRTISIFVKTKNGSWMPFEFNAH